MTAAEQPTLDLGDYRGRAITGTAVKLANATDGFHPQTAMSEPRIFEIGEELTIAVRVVVTAHGVQAVKSEKDDEELKGTSIIQTWKCQTVAIISDAGPVKKALDSVAAAEKAAAEAKARAAKKPAGRKPGVRRGQLRSVGSSLEEALQGNAAPPAAGDE